MRWRENVYTGAYFTVFLIALGLSIAQLTILKSIPVVAMQWLWLFIVIGYAPVLVSFVREGIIWIPPQSVLRHEKPVLFWIVVATHVFYMIASAAILAYRLT